MIRVMRYRYFIVLLILPVLLGLKKIDFKGYKDPDFLDYKIETTILCFGSTTMVLEEAFTKSFAKQKDIKNIKWVRCDDIFPPTRDWTGETRRTQALKLGYQSILGIGINFESSGDATYTSYGDGNAYSSAMTSQSEWEIVVFDMELQKKVWVAKVGITNKGTFYANNAKNDGKALAKRLVSELKKSEMIN